MGLPSSFSSSCSRRLRLCAAKTQRPNRPTGAGRHLTVSGPARWPASDRIDVKIKGKGGHGAMSHRTVDTISIAAHVISTLLQTIISRETNPNDPAGR